MSEMSDDKKPDARRDELLYLLAEGMTLEDAAQMIGVSSRQVRRWRTADPVLDEAVQDAMASIDDQVEAVTFKNCLDPDPAHNTLRMFWLKSRRPEVYRETIKQEHVATVEITKAARAKAGQEIEQWRQEMAEKLSSMPRP